MYFVDKINKIYGNKKIVFFVDMDGVITDYNFGHPLEFDKKRPINTNIKTFKTLSLMGNIELYILSICKNNNQIIDKNKWLDKYAPFFKYEKRIIISKESNPNFSSKELKCEYLNKIISDVKCDNIIVIDDDNEILKYLSENIEKIDLYQASSIID